MLQESPSLSGSFIVYQVIVTVEVEGLAEVHTITLISKLPPVLTTIKLSQDFQQTIQALIRTLPSPTVHVRLERICWNKAQICYNLIIHSSPNLPVMRAK